MKKLAVLFSNLNPTLFEITSYLKDKTRIVWLSDNKDLLNSASNFEVEFDMYKEKYLKEFDLIASTDFEKETENKILKVRKSLLPSFSEGDPVKKAIEAGVNVVGVSVYSTNPFEITAQYPVFIEKPYDYNQIVFKLQTVEQILYPLVIEKILNNEKFNTGILMRQNSCNGNCGGCH